MKKLKKEPQKTDLNEFLYKCESISESLNRSKNMSKESRENVEWYCDYLVRKYYELYVSDIIGASDS